MAGARGLEVPVPREASTGEREADRGGVQAVAKEMAGEPVEAGQDVTWGEAIVGVAADSGAETAHGRRGPQVMTGDVTNRGEDGPDGVWAMSYQSPPTSAPIPDGSYMADRSRPSMSGRAESRSRCSLTATARSWS